MRLLECPNGQNISEPKIWQCYNWVLNNIKCLKPNLQRKKTAAKGSLFRKIDLK